MKRTQVRMSEGVYAQIARVAAQEGVSVSQYLRETALARVWFEAGRTGGPNSDIGQALLALARQAEAENTTIDALITRLLNDEKRP